MRFTIFLLVVLVIGCVAGSLVTQGQTYAWYAQAYSERTAGLIIALGLDDAFHSLWFLAITALLCLNLIFCNLMRVKLLVRVTRDAKDAAKLPIEFDGVARDVRSPEEVFHRFHMPKFEETKVQDLWTYYSSKNRIGYWGAWVCHLGILLLILGFTLGQMTKEQYTVYGVPGQTRAIGDTGKTLTIDDFRIDLRDDDTVEQYTAKITVTDASGAAGTSARSESAEISVNHPAKIYGMKFYQNSTGWAARARVYEDGTLLQEQVVCAGDGFSVTDNPDLIVYFNAFYPDLVIGSTGTPESASGRLNNPGYLYSIYYQNQIVGMNVLSGEETIKIDAYEVVFDEPQNYTLIQIKKDSFTGLAFAGGLVTLLGLVLSFYVIPIRIWVFDEGPGKNWTVCGKWKNGGPIMLEKFLDATLQPGEME